MSSTEELLKSLGWSEELVEAFYEGKVSGIAVPQLGEIEDYTEEASDEYVFTVENQPAEISLKKSE